jgi:LacI family transcriptional regulator
MAFVHNDDTMIGQKAGRYFQTLGDFRSFMFLPAPAGTRWSEEREAGFREALAEFGHECRSVRLAEVEECDADNMKILGAIRMAEKPCAVFAAWDGRAAQALTICSENGIKVPEQVVVLGTDDDELVCDHAVPPLSSVKPDHHKVGTMAVAELNRLFKCATATRHAIHCPCKTIVERESTRPIPPMSQLVRRAIALIHERAAQGLSPMDVADALGVSRRLLDMRLVQAENATLHELISRSRLDAVARELKKSRLPIRTIARKLGYGDIKHLERLFKQRFDVPMGTFRESL